MATHQNRHTPRRLLAVAAAGLSLATAAPLFAQQEGATTGANVGQPAAGGQSQPSGTTEVQDGQFNQRGLPDNSQQNGNRTQDSAGQTQPNQNRAGRNQDGQTTANQNQVMQGGGGSDSPWLGITLNSLADQGQNQQQQGATIAEVTPNGAAAEVGLQPGDVVVAVNGQNITSAEQLAQAIQQLRIGDTASLAIMRGGEQLALTVPLGSRNQVLGQPGASGGQFAGGSGANGMLDQELASVQQELLNLALHVMYLREQLGNQGAIDEFDQQLEQFGQQMQQSNSNGMLRGGVDTNNHTAPSQTDRIQNTNGTGLQPGNTRPQSTPPNGTPRPSVPQ